MVREVGEETSDEGEPVRSPVESEVVPGIRVVVLFPRRKIGRIAGDHVEATQPGKQVGPYRFHLQAPKLR